MTIKLSRPLPNNLYSRVSFANEAALHALFHLSIPIYLCRSWPLLNTQMPSHHALHSRPLFTHRSIFAASSPSYCHLCLFSNSSCLAFL